MSPTGVRRAVLCSSLTFLLPQATLAQSSRAGCARGAALRGVAGGAVGAWLGFFAAKVRLSDWDEASHGPAAHRTKNRYTITGAAIGLAAGTLLHIGTSCGRAARPAGPTISDQALHNPITAEEITRSGINGNVYELVYSLRRPWLNLRGIDALTEGPEILNVDGQSIELDGEPRLMVYLDNAKLGSVEQLRTLPIGGVVAVRYFTGSEATYRWGAGHGHGVIQVLTSPQ